MGNVTLVRYEDIVSLKDRNDTTSMLKILFIYQGVLTLL